MRMGFVGNSLAERHAKGERKYCRGLNNDLHSGHFLITAIVLHASSFPQAPAVDLSRLGCHMRTAGSSSREQESGAPKGG